MNTLTDKIQRYLRQLAPHIREREASVLLSQAVAALLEYERMEQGSVDITVEEFRAFVDSKLAVAQETPDAQPK